MGLAIARRLATAGARALALTDISGTRLDENVRVLRGEFPALEIVALRGDITRREEAEAFARATRNNFV